jgi:GNAT superfamily N-acetyltransferase
MITTRTIHNKQSESIKFEGVKMYAVSRRNSPDIEVMFRACVPEDVPDILRIQEKVRKLIPDSYSYIETTEEDIRESIEVDVTIGAWHDDRMVGFTMLLALRDTERNLAHSLGYAPEYALQCATNDGTWVDPEYHGYGIQYWFIVERDRLGVKMGAKELLTCTSPINYACQRNFLKNGYEIIDKMPLYGGHPRVIIRKYV